MSDPSIKIREFVIDNFLFGNPDGLSDESSFLDEGIIDSTGVLELITFLEEEFSIQVGDDELIPENLDSVKRATEFVKKKSSEFV